MNSQHRVFVRPGRAITVPKAVKGRAGFDFPAILQGSTAHFSVYYDPVLGTNGESIANAVLASCEADYSRLSTYFGGIRPPSFKIIIHPGIGGAYHRASANDVLYCDAQTTPNVNADHTCMLAVAEEVEVYSVLQGLGWDCGASNGEGLSRVLATEMYPAELDGFSSAATWLDKGRPDFVNKNDPSDRNHISYGCSVLFLNYLHYQLGHTWESIVQAGGSTLAETCRKLTGLSNPLTRFKAVLQTKYPEGTPSGLTTDNPFPIVLPPPPPPNP